MLCVPRRSPKRNRLGRSLLLNTTFLTAINVQKCIALFNASPPIALPLSKAMASQLKAHLLETLHHDSAIIGGGSGTFNTDSDTDT